MMMKNLIRKNRTYRRFYQEVEIDYSILEELIDLARLSPSGANLQPLKYIISNKPEKNELIFQHLKWAAYLTDWNGPQEGEKPTAYIIIVGDKNISTNFFCDQGIASQSILLGACEKGLGGCILAAVDREDLKNKFTIPDSYEILLVIALGKPKEVVVLEELKDTGNIKYWRDENSVHHVPKRKLKDIILDF
jgi:nitroreductase